MQLEGDLRSARLPRLLRYISALRRTGILTVQSEHDMLAVTFLDGQIVAADAMNEPMEEGLGRVLESRGLVSPEKFSEILGAQQASGERIVELLLREGLIDRRQLLDAIRLQTYGLLLQLLGWHEGEYNMFVGDEISYESGVQPISVEELMVRSASDLGADAPLSGPLPELRAPYERSSSNRSIKVLGRDGDDPDAEPGSLWLTASEVLVLEQCDGKRPAASMIGALKLDEYRMQYALFQLVRGNVLQRASGFAAPVEEKAAPPSGLTPAESLLRTDVHQRVREEIPAPGLDVPVPSLGELDAAALPAPEPAKAARPKPRRSTEELGVVLWLWMSRAFGVGLLALVVALLPARSGRNGVYFPFPWQQAQREAFEGGQRSVLYHKIDGASRSYYLLFGRFPEELGILADLQIIGEPDLYDPAGNWLSYSAGDLNYLIQPLKDGVAVPGLEVTGDIQGDILLNRQFVELDRSGNTRPVYLID